MTPKTFEIRMMLKANPEYWCNTYFDTNQRYVNKRTGELLIQNIINKRRSQQGLVGLDRKKLPADDVFTADEMEEEE
jgi:hypothetical protein